MPEPDSVETSLSSKRFEFEVEITDPQTGFSFLFTMEVDTGNPIALALPRSCEHFLTNQLSTIDLRGAGTSNSPAYEANITAIEGMEISYETMAVMTLSHDEYGLIGVELLKYLETKIHGEPDSKKLRLTNTHL